MSDRDFLRLFYNITEVTSNHDVSGCQRPWTSASPVDDYKSHSAIDRIINCILFIML